MRRILPELLDTERLGSPIARRAEWLDDQAVPQPNWTEILTALGAVATPIAVIVFGAILTRRQSRNELLLKARIEYYRELAPDLNRLMTYMMFIGTWRDVSPPDVIALKRRLDAAFYVAAPLFSEVVVDRYQRYMSRCFKTFGLWGSDALIRSSAYRRRQSWQAPQPWDTRWDRLFELRDGDPVERSTLEALKSAHDDLIAALVLDLNINRARSEYTSTRVVGNASGQVRTLDGAPATEV
ncbi:MAG: hypothetical protein Q7T17_09985 [Microbacterium sp.]|uniref:hypothetical protein n=1 Tax=Microbacterium sp. TaxID=51671 RepID=UPI00271FEDAB|nr:hypothetical protein [Microbacterium sp.]MDO8383293.1 hypothetical protein [Microbacterium sp.]